jgi:hypothetical protein
MKKICITIIALGLYGFALAQLPTQNPYPNAPAIAANINQYNFYIDSLRANNQQVQSFAAGTNNTTGALSINLTGTITGVHQLYAKVVDINGKPSIINVGNFYMESDIRYQNAPSIATNINKYNFYVDSVTSANEQTQNFTAAATNSIPSQSINLTGTITGFHQLYAKVTDITGKPSVINLGNFYVEGDNRYQNTPSVATNINRYEFYIDSVTTLNIQPLSFAAGATNTTASTSINLAGVIPGVHNLYARVFDVNNKQSIVNLGQFAKDQNFHYPNIATAAPALQTLEYFVDYDPGYNMANAITIPGSSTTEVLNNISINISNTLSAGVHYLHIRSKQNPWSMDNVIPFEVESVLPVSWLYVRAQLVNKQTFLTWGTIQEVDTKSFEIEHSMDGRNFIKIGEVTAAGNSSTAKNYLYNHTNPVNGFNYYRIKQIDNNGSFKYSEIVTILKKDNLTSVIVAPNPVKDILHIVEPNNRFVLSAEVYSLDGKRILQKNINTDVQVFSILVNNLPAAQYILKVNYKTESKSYRFVKE